MLRLFVLCFLSVSFTYAKDMSPTSAYYRFATSSFASLDVSVSSCDDAARSDSSAEWICAQSSQDYASFIYAWNTLQQNNTALVPLSAWYIFNDASGNTDFFARAYQFNSTDSTQFIIAYDPSEGGREIAIAASPSIFELMQYSAQQLTLPPAPATPIQTHTTPTHATPTPLPPVATTPAPLPPVTTTLPPLPPATPALPSPVAPARPAVADSYNCSDFADQNAAIDFFNSRGFSASYDPHKLDADNNGVPCESLPRRM